jgi:CRP-like cAMP-binding protein
LPSPSAEQVQNRLLASLPPAVLSALMPKLHQVPMSLREVLVAPEAVIHHVYFPVEGMISLVAVLEDGRRGEVGIIGREGMFGVSLLAGIETSFTEAVVQLPGSALRMSAADFRREILSDGPFRAMLTRYNEALAAQISQTAVCNANHDVEERLARWLLMAHDRASGDELLLTQDFIAMMLGVHRPSVTVSAGILQRAGLISYVKGGRVTVVDRSLLEGAACECYATVLRRFQSAMGPNYRLSA